MVVRASDWYLEVCHFTFLLDSDVFLFSLAPCIMSIFHLSQFLSLAVRIYQCMDRSLTKLTILLFFCVHHQSAWLCIDDYIL